MAGPDHSGRTTSVAGQYYSEMVRELRALKEVLVYSEAELRMFLLKKHTFSGIPHWKSKDFESSPNPHQCTIQLLKYFTWRDRHLAPAI